MRVLIHHAAQQRAQPRKSRIGSRHHGIGAHDQCPGDPLPSPIIPTHILGVEIVPALIVQKRLAHPPASGFANHFYRIAQAHKLFRHAAFVMQPAEGNLCPVTYQRAGVNNSG